MKYTLLLRINICTYICLLCVYCTVYVLQSLADKVASKLKNDDFDYNEAQVFYLKTKADYYRHLTRNVEEAMREGNLKQD